MTPFITPPPSLAPLHDHALYLPALRMLHTTARHWAMRVQSTAAAKADEVHSVAATASKS